MRPGLLTAGAVVFAQDRSCPWSPHIRHVPVTKRLSPGRNAVGTRVHRRAGPFGCCLRRPPSIRHVKVLSLQPERSYGPHGVGLEPAELCVHGPVHGPHRPAQPPLPSVRWRSERGCCRLSEAFVCTEMRRAHRSDSSAVSTPTGGSFSWLF